MTNHARSQGCPNADANPTTSAMSLPSMYVIVLAITGPHVEWKVYAHAVKENPYGLPMLVASFDEESIF